jgi:hypothetical protein
MRETYTTVFQRPSSDYRYVLQCCARCTFLSIVAVLPSMAVLLYNLGNGPGECVLRRPPLACMTREPFATRPRSNLSDRFASACVVLVVETGQSTVLICIFHYRIKEINTSSDVLVLPGFELVLNEQHATWGVARDHLSATSVVTPLSAAVLELSRAS